MPRPSRTDWMARIIGIDNEAVVELVSTQISEGGKRTGRQRVVVSVPVPLPVAAVAVWTRSCHDVSIWRLMRFCMTTLEPYNSMCASPGSKANSAQPEVQSLIYSDGGTLIDRLLDLINHWR